MTTFNSSGRESLTCFIHKDPETSGWVSQASRDPPVDIPRRYANPTSRERHSPEPFGLDHTIVSSSGSDYQRRKIHHRPSQSLEFLGFTISASMHIQLPNNKMRKIRQDAQSLLAHNTVTIRDLPRFDSKASATSWAVQIAPLHFRTHSNSDNRVRCFKHWMGSSMPEQEYWRLMGKRGSSPSYQLSGASCCLSSPKVLHKGN